MGLTLAMYTGQAPAAAIGRSLRAQIDLALPDVSEKFRILSVTGRESVSTQLGQLECCHASIVFLRPGDLTAALLVGALQQAQVPLLCVFDDSHAEALGPITKTLAPSQLVAVPNTSDMPMEFYRRVVAEARSLVARPRTPIGLVRELWFDSHPSEVHVVNPPEVDKSNFAKPDAANYIYIDNLGDRDSLVEVLSLLGRAYPRTRTYKYSSDDFPKQLLENNLVVIGGPGVEGSEPGNQLCRLMRERVSLTAEYAVDGESATFNSTSWPTERDEQGRICADFGYFARFPNPFNPSCTVVMIHGTHTVGVLGAVKAFSDHANAEPNIEAVSSVVGVDGAFESGFAVEILDGSVTCPRVADVRPVA